VKRPAKKKSRFIPSQGQSDFVGTEINNTRLLLILRSPNLSGRLSLKLFVIYFYQNVTYLNSWARPGVTSSRGEGRTTQRTARVDDLICSQRFILAF